MFPAAVLAGGRVTRPDAQVEAALDVVPEDTLAHKILAAEVVALRAELQDARDGEQHLASALADERWRYVQAVEAAEAREKQLRKALAALVGWSDGKNGDDFGTTEWADARAALGSAAAADTETLTVWWMTKGQGVTDGDIPVPYERKLPAADALRLGEQLAAQDRMEFVKVFGANEEDVRWRYRAAADTTEGTE